MIIRMAKVRILGPLAGLDAAMRRLQSLELVQLCGAAPREALRPIASAEAIDRRQRTLRSIVADIESVFEAIPRPALPAEVEPFAGTTDLARWAREARRTRRAIERLATRRDELEDEQAGIDRYHAFFSAFEALPFGGSGDPAAQVARVYYLLLRQRRGESVEKLEDGLRSAIGGEFSLYSHPLTDEDTALLLMVATSTAAKVEQLLADAGIEELQLSASAGGASLTEIRPQVQARQEELRGELSAVSAELEAVAAAHGEALARAAVAARNEIIALSGRDKVRQSEHAFVVEAWLPEASIGLLTSRMEDAIGEQLVVERVDEQEWEAADVPVILSNPRIFRPFEIITRMVPLPRYGTIDATPFVAVFFPMFFGIILGDVGYGTLIGVLSIVVHRRTAAGSPWQAVSEIGGACAVFSIVFGLVYGELLGDLGHRWLGLRPLGFDREEAILPFLGLTVALGFVHVLVGLGMGVVAALRHDKPKALGRGVSALMLLLLAAALLAAIELLPSELLTPSVVALLVAFPILIATEGLIAPIELLSAVANILSYTRIMALGTASVMMAVVANRMAGAMGSALVGVLFAVLFHIVNFALGVFAPTIHALRLHYVEFWGKFQTESGMPYRPFALWHPNREGAR